MFGVPRVVTQVFRDDRRISPPWGPNLASLSSADCREPSPCRCRRVAKAAIIAAMTGPSTTPAVTSADVAAASTACTAACVRCGR